MSSKDMNIGLNNILGEKIAKGDCSSIYRNGIINDFDYKHEYILWENVAFIYVGGIKSSINYIPTNEVLDIKIIDSSNKQINFSLSSIFRMRKEKQKLFNDIYSMILNKIADRQWIDFLKKLQDGEQYSFGDFKVARDSFYFRKLFKGYSDKIDINCIKGYDIKQGYLHILYQKLNQKLKTKNVGLISKIPNIHLLETLINMIVKDYKI